MTDPDGLVTAWNRAAEKLYGWNEREVLGQSILDLLVPPEHAALAADISARLKSGESWEGELEVRRRDGGLLHVFVSTGPLLDETGQTIGRIGVSVDITRRVEDHRRAADALRASSKERADAVISAAIDGIITMDHQGRIVEFNPVAERMFGYSRDDVVGQEMAELIIPPSLREQHRQGLAHYLQTGEGPVIGQRLQLNGMRSDGSEFPVELSITRVDTEGPPVFTGWVRDLTEAKRASDTLTFLLQASTVLASSIEYRSTLENLAQLIVDSLADACLIDMRDNGDIRRMAAVARDKSKQPLVDRLLAYSPDPESDHPVARVIRTGEPVVQPDAGEERAAAALRHDEIGDAAAKLATQSYMCVPLTVRDRVIGTVLLLSTDPLRRYGEADVNLAQDLARRAAMAVDNARLHAETKQAMEIKEESLALLDTLLATAPVGLAFVDRDLRYVRINDTLAALTAAAPEQHLGRTIREMLPDLADEVESLHRRVLETGEPVLDVEISGEVRGRPGVTGYWLSSYYPVRGPEGKVLGVGVVVVDITETKSTEAELRATRQELTDQLEDVTRLLQLSGRLSASLELQPVLDEVLRAVTGLQDADSGVLRLHDPETDELEAMASVGLSEEYLTEVARVPARAGVWGKAFAERRPFISVDVEVDPDFEGYRDAARRAGYRAVYTSPLITRRGDIIGTISTNFRQPRRPSDRELRLIELYAYEASDVIDNARLYREAREATERLEFLAEASRILSSSLDYTWTLRQLARVVVPRLADWCSVDIREDDGSIHQVTVEHVDPGKVRWAKELQQRYPPDPTAPTGAPNVIRTGHSELYPEIPDELLVESATDEEMLRILREIGFSSVMVVPLTARGRTIGAISFVTAESDRRYGPQDLAFAEDLARRAAQSVDNARLFTRQRHIARTLQESLLPPGLPRIPGVDVAARYEAAGEGTEVGGDFYDLFETTEGQWGVVMGDVCGKGPEAAAVTGLARYTIRAAAMRERSPSAILSTLNDAIRQQRTDMRFATVAYLRMAKRNGHVDLEVACGGHPLPLVLRHDGSVQAVGRPGTLLGIFEDAELADDRAMLSPGDSVILFTDGMSQDRGAAGPMSEDELTSLVAASAGREADEIADRLLVAATTRDSGEARDDVAVLVLRVQP